MRLQSVKDIESEFLEPSFKYLVKNGIENTSVRDLCREMNISYGSLYYWFDDKDDIFISVVRYGIAKVVEDLFKAAFEKLSDPKLFFDTILYDVDRNIKELKLVFQFAASPTYGERMHQKTEEFLPMYNEYIERLAVLVGCTADKLKPIIFLLISVISDYTVWEDYGNSKMQLDFLCERVLEAIRANKH